MHLEWYKHLPHDSNAPCACVACRWSRHSAPHVPTHTHAKRQRSGGNVPLTSKLWRAQARTGPKILRQDVGEVAHLQTGVRATLSEMRGRCNGNDERGKQMYLSRKICHWKLVRRCASVLRLGPLEVAQHCRQRSQHTRLLRNCASQNGTNRKNKKIKAAGNPTYSTTARHTGKTN